MSSWHDIATAGSTVVSCFVSKRIKRLRRYAGERTAALKKKKNIVHKPMGGNKEEKEKKKKEKRKDFLVFSVFGKKKKRFSDVLQLS
jgi:hypothetical protein